MATVLVSSAAPCSSVRLCQCRRFASGLCGDEGRACHWPLSHLCEPGHADILGLGRFHAVFFSQMRGRGGRLLVRRAPAILGVDRSVCCANLNSMRFTATEEDARERLDRFIAGQLEDVSRSRVLSWIRAGRVQVSGAPQRKASHRLRPGETVDVEPADPPPLTVQPEAIDLSILYEDDHLAVVNKEAGMSVHAGAGIRSGTLVNALLHHFADLSAVSGAARPGIVHRLDRFTTGVMVVAKRDRAHRRLQEQFQSRKVSKLYWAAVEGCVPADPHGNARLQRHGRPVMQDGKWWLRIDMPIRRDKRNRVKMATGYRGRQAVTDMRAMRTGRGNSLVEVRIHTGRTHQVRVHLSSAGHPVVGDRLYGARRRQALAGLPGRHLLHARRLGFTHPETARPMQFEAPLPADFEAGLKALGL